MTTLTLQQEAPLASPAGDELAVPAPVGAPRPPRLTATRPPALPGPRVPGPRVPARPARAAESASVVDVEAALRALPAPQSRTRAGQDPATKRARQERRAAGRRPRTDRASISSRQQPSAYPVPPALARPFRIDVSEAASPLGTLKQVAGAAPVAPQVPAAKSARGLGPTPASLRAPAPGRAVAGLPAVAGRTALLLDLENLTYNTPGRAAAVIRQVVEATGPVDHIFAVGFGRLLTTLLPVLVQLGISCAVSPKGRDGADRELLERAAHLTGTGYDRIVVGSGDHAFADLGEQAQLVVVVPHSVRVATRLSAAAVRTVLV